MKPTIAMDWLKNAKDYIYCIALMAKESESFVRVFLPRIHEFFLLFVVDRTGFNSIAAYVYKTRAVSIRNCPG